MKAKSSNIIRSEQSAAFERWTAHAFEGNRRKPPPVTAPPSAPPPEPPPLPKLPTAEEIEALHETARQEGYAEGYQEGLEAAAEAARQELSGRVVQLEGILDGFREAVGQLDQTMADKMLDLALEVAAQVTRGTLAVQRDGILPVIREAIDALPVNHGTVHLHLHPDDATLVRAHASEQLLLSGVHIIDDPAISAGGCQLKAGASEVDASLETRWKRVLESIGANPDSWRITP